MRKGTSRRNAQSLVTVRFLYPAKRISLTFFLDSRVKCSNCQQSRQASLGFSSWNTDKSLVGHTKVRCKEPIVDEDAGGHTRHGGDSGGHTGHGGDFGNNAMKSAATRNDDNWGESAPTVIEAPVEGGCDEW
jgi:hypothetical protein